MVLHTPCSYYTDPSLFARETSSHEHFSPIANIANPWQRRAVFTFLCALLLVVTSVLPATAGNTRVYVLPRVQLWPPRHVPLPSLPRPSTHAMLKARYKPDPFPERTKNPKRTRDDILWEWEDYSPQELFGAQRGLLLATLHDIEAKVCACRYPLRLVGCLWTFSCVLIPVVPFDDV